MIKTIINWNEYMLRTYITKKVLLRRKLKVEKVWRVTARRTFNRWRPGQMYKQPGASIISISSSVVPTGSRCVNAWEYTAVGTPDENV